MPTFKHQKMKDKRNYWKEYREDKPVVYCTIPESRWEELVRTFKQRFQIDEEII